MDLQSEIYYWSYFRFAPHEEDENHECHEKNSDDNTDSGDGVCG